MSASRPPIGPQDRRLVFVVPPVTAEDRYGPMASAGNSLPPHAFLYLGAVARAAGWQVEIVDGPAEEIPLEDCAAAVLAHKPTVVGFTTTTMSVAKAATVAEDLRRAAPELLLMVGGPHVTALGKETIERLSVFDLGCVGEGEDALLAVLRHLEAGTDPRSVPGIVSRADDGSVIENPPSCDEVALAELPDLAWDMLTDFPEKYHAAATYLNKTPFTDLIVSRGCRYRCTFCDNQTFGRSIRALPVDKILANIDRLVNEYGIKSLFFTDDSLMTLRSDFEAVCRGLIERNYDLEWSINARTSEIDEEILALMKRAGCWQISYGVESGSWEILKRIKKGASPRMQKRALELTAAAGIKSNAYIIIGFPGETKETLAETEEFLRSVPIDTLRLTYFTPFPNTDITHDMEGEGEIVADWTRLNFYNIAYIPNGLTRKDLERTYRKIMMRFYLKPRVLASFLPHLIVPRKAAALLRGTFGLGKLLVQGTGTGPAGGASGTGGECHS
ncbi:MAG: B12-binding domain-containing radical SAM protein [Planctomycetota bacterium]|nr:MAG: B12-binding domain-containing radical SAM protein [Planctomycetota bacterium]